MARAALTVTVARAAARAMAEGAGRRKLDAAGRWAPDSRRPRTSSRPAVRGGSGGYFGGQLSLRRRGDAAISSVAVNLGAVGIMPLAVVCARRTASPLPAQAPARPYAMMDLRVLLYHRIGDPDLE